jgi:hypothetical protein
MFLPSILRGKSPASTGLSFGPLIVLNAWFDYTSDWQPIISVRRSYDSALGVTLRAIDPRCYDLVHVYVSQHRAFEKTTSNNIVPLAFFVAVSSLKT